MPVAAETFWVEYDGRRELIQAGLDHVCEGHELLRRYPGKWARDGRPLRRRRASARSLKLPAQPSAASHRTRTRGTPALLKGPPRLTVALGSSARRTIEEEFLSTTRVDGYETGGWLFAEPSRSWHKSIEVRLAGGPGKGAKRGPSSFQPDDYRQAEEQLAWDGAGRLCRVGDWHSHPGYDTAPSVGDLDVWQTCFVRANEDRGVGFYVGLIAALNREGFPRMQLAAYVLSYDRFGRVVCEPPTLTNRKDDSWRK
jgi:JAB domain-containing protein similar to deubiquitination enzymes